MEATMKGKAIEENQNASSCVSASRFSRLSDRLEEKLEPAPSRILPRRHRSNNNFYCCDYFTASYKTMKIENDSKLLRGTLNSGKFGTWKTQKFENHWSRRFQRRLRWTNSNLRTILAYCKGFKGSTKLVLLSVDAYVVVGYFCAKIQFLLKLDLDDGHSRGTI
ncbi:hypothetical protein ACFE04_019803 [Oxalis oulophora]